MSIEVVRDTEIARRLNEHYKKEIYTGDHKGVATPVPIPNTEVKGSLADDTTLWWGGKVGRRQFFLFYSSEYNCHYINKIL